MAWVSFLIRLVGALVLGTMVIAWFGAVTTGRYADYASALLGGCIFIIPFLILVKSLWRR